MSKIKIPARATKKAGAKPAVSASSVVRKQSRRVAAPARAATATTVREPSAGSRPRSGFTRKVPAAVTLDLSPATTISKQAKGKTALVANLIRRQDGASLADLMAATGWQAHSVRGMISGVLRKKQGIAVTLATGADGARIYRVAA